MKTRGSMLFSEGVISRNGMEEHVLIIVRVPPDEIENPTFGGPKLVNEIKRELEEDGRKVSILSWYSLGTLSSKFLVIRKKAKRQNAFLNIVEKMLAINEELRWFFSLVISLLGEYLSRIDVKLMERIKKELANRKPDIILYNGSIGAYIFMRIAKQFNIPFVIVEHNVDYYFYYEKFKVLKPLAFPLIFILKQIELQACSNADKVIVLNKKDRDRLVKEGVSFKKILIWKFRIKKYDESYIKSLLYNAPSQIKQYIGKKPIVCFLGANYTLNIVAVKYILSIARRLPHVIFLIVGSVRDAFKDVDKPANVIFTGYVKDVDPYLAAADLFINIKLASDTGVEAKMLDYLKFNKPIISTEIGARGFEHFENVIVVPLAKIADTINKLVNNKEQNSMIRY